MPQHIPRDRQEEDDGTLGDQPVPRASEDEVLEETVRLFREGRRDLEADPREQKPASE